MHVLGKPRLVATPIPVPALVLRHPVEPAQIGVVGQPGQPAALPAVIQPSQPARTPRAALGQRAPRAQRRPTGWLAPWVLWLFDIGQRAPLGRARAGALS